MRLAALLCGMVGGALGAYLPALFWGWLVWWHEGVLLGAAIAAMLGAALSWGRPGLGGALMLAGALAYGSMVTVLGDGWRNSILVPSGPILAGALLSLVPGRRSDRPPATDVAGEPVPDDQPLPFFLGLAAGIYGVVVVYPVLAFPSLLRDLDYVRQSLEAVGHDLRFVPLLASIAGLAGARLVRTQPRPAAALLLGAMAVWAPFLPDLGWWIAGAIPISFGLAGVLALRRPVEGLRPVAFLRSRPVAVALVAIAVAVAAVGAVTTVNGRSDGPKTYARGETVRTFDGDLTVDRAEVHASLPSQLGFFLPKDRFVVVYLAVEDDTAHELWVHPDLVDDQDRGYSPDFAASRDLRRVHGVDGELAADQPYLVPFVFDVPPDATGLRLTQDAADPAWWLDIGEPVAPAEAGPTPVAAAPPALRIGETAHAPAWDLTVTDVFAASELLSFSHEGRYVAITFRVENTNSVPLAFPFGDLLLVDEGGRSLELHEALTEGLARSQQNPVMIGSPGSNNPPTTDPIEPGQATELVIVFYAPPEVEEVWLVPKTAGAYPWGIHLGAVAAMPSS